MRRAVAFCLASLGVGLVGSLVHCSSSSDSGGTTPPPSGDSGSQIDTGISTGDAATADQETPDAAPDADASDNVDSGTECTTTCADTSLTCCDGKCVDTKHDPKHCGGCGTACTDTQFCNGTSCNDATFGNICNNPNGSIVHGTFDADNTNGDSLGATIATCTPAVQTRTVSQLDTGVLEPVTNRPILGVGDTFIAGGGPYGQVGIGYMDNAGRTPIYVPQGDPTTYEFRQRAANVDVVNVPTSSVTATHDFFVLQLAVEPTSGTLCFSGYGFGSRGTTAAAYYFQHTVFPNRATYTQSWYVFEWTDSDATAGPSAGDTFTSKGH